LTIRNFELTQNGSGLWGPGPACVSSFAL
jgi:hypothetical protein